jgi:gliding motility-associated-like protein
MKKTLCLAILAITALSCKKTTTTTPPVTSGPTCTGPGTFYADDSTSLVVASAFTPNGDGINDIYRASYENLDAGYSLSIKDSKGVQMFSTTDPDLAWDGKHSGSPAPEANYDVDLSFKSKMGITKTFSYKIALFRPAVGGCVKASNECGFGDEMHPRFGLNHYPTAEKICP